MALTTKAGLLAAMEGAQQIIFSKTLAVTGMTSALWGSIIDRPGNPGAGVLAGTSTAAGVVPVAGNAGFPSINAFGAGKTGYLGRVIFAPMSANDFRMRLCDLLWKGGNYNFNSAVVLAAQPDYSGRLPGGDYKGLEIWVEATTTFTGTPSIAVTYTNQDGVAGRSTGTVSMKTALNPNRLVQLPLQAGDSGVQKIESVTATVATGGSFNILVLRPLWSGHLPGAINDTLHGPDLTDLPIVYATSALYFMANPENSFQIDLFDATIEVIQG